MFAFSFPSLPYYFVDLCNHLGSHFSILWTTSLGMLFCTLLLSGTFCFFLKFLHLSCCNTCFFDLRFWVDNRSDRTIEKAGEGYDWTHASIDWTLSDHVEALALRTGASLDGTGNSAANFISGNSGNNVISGMAGDDVLEGRGGDDRLIGGSGSDKLSGNAGKDIMFGGDDLSRDTFIFNAASDSRVGSGRDVVHDFVSGVDKLDFSSFDANRSASGSQDFRYSGTAAAANSVWTVDAGSNLLVRGDVDGDRTADFEILITDIESLTRADFLF